MRTSLMPTKSGFLNLGIIYILGWMIFCYGKMYYAFLGC